MSTVPKQSRQWSSYLESFKSGARGGSQTPYYTRTPKTRLSDCFQYGNVLYIEASTLCSQIQTRTNLDKVRQTTVPKKSRQTIRNQHRILPESDGRIFILMPTKSGASTFLKHQIQASRSAPEGERMAKRGVIYRITVKNWDKYNSTKKKGHRNFLLSVGFLDDAKIRQLTPATTLLFLSCLCLSAESSQSQFDVTHESLCFQSRVKSGSLQSQLDLLQELQLVTYEKIEPLNNRIEKKENRREGNSTEPAKLVAMPAPVAKVPVNLIPGKTIELKQELMNSWAETYPQEFLEEEFKKARNWILSNPHKAPKSDFARFLNTWFSKGWEQYRKTLKSNPVRLTPEMVAEILGAEE